MYSTNLTTQGEVWQNVSVGLSWSSREAKGTAMLSDTEARRVASEWHSGGGSPEYVFASTGAITESLHAAIDDTLIFAHGNLGVYTIKDVADLNRLLTYVDHHGVRGPVEGWGDLTW